MRKRFLKKSDVLREGYVKGLKKAQRIIAESIENDPFTGTSEWNELDEEDKELLSDYLEIFDAEDTLQETLEKAHESYRGTFSDWGSWAQEEYEAGIISADDLVQYDCVDWEKAGKTFNDSYEMSERGSVFCTEI